MSKIIIQRLHNQCLLETNFQTPGEVVSWMGAVQSQDYAYAKWALGLRMIDETDALIEQAFNEGAILRTHVMRPTWHFVTPADIRWMLELTAPRVNAFNAHKYRQLELSEGLLQRSNAILARALQGGKQLTRLDLRGVLEKAGISTGPITPGGEHRMAHILMRAELEGIICSGPRRGKQFTYMLLEERAPHARKLTREESLAELTRRYFTSHGPASAQDFSWWSGLTMADAKAGLAMLGSELCHAVIDEQTYWFSSAMPAVSDETMTSHLLPVLDEYTVAYKDRSAIIDTAHIHQPGDQRDVFFNHVILLNGQIVGTWHRTLKKDAVIVNTRLFTALAADGQHAVATAIRRYGKFLGLPIA